MFLIYFRNQKVSFLRNAQRLFVSIRKHITLFFLFQQLELSTNARNELANHSLINHQLNHQHSKLHMLHLPQQQLQQAPLKMFLQCLLKHNQRALILMEIVKKSLKVDLICIQVQYVMLQYDAMSWVPKNYNLRVINVMQYLNPHFKNTQMGYLQQIFLAFRLIFRMLIFTLEYNTLKKNTQMVMKISSFTPLNNDFAIDKYNVLGKGANGTVYKGYYGKQKKFIAVKYLQAIQAKMQKWQRQLKVMETVKHQNIVGFYGSLQTPEGVYFFIQFCAGGSLGQLILKTGKLSELKVLDLFSQIIDAMIHLNQKNILHRDMKPDNILLDENNNAKVADFGLARQFDTKMTFTGTPLYEAPQIIFKSKSYDIRCDVWSVGLILYEMLTGQQYFKEIKSMNKLQEALTAMNSGKRPIKYPEELDSAWIQITKYMLTFDNEKRPTFHEVNNLFNSIKPNLMTRLKKKYGFDNEDFDNQDGLRVTQSINPYMNNGQSTLKGLEQQIKQQQSYMNMINLRKYLTHFRLKSEILSGIASLFNHHEYNCVKNVHKYLLLFLANAMYVARIHKHLSDLKILQLRLPDKDIKITDFIPQHEAQVKELIKQFQNKHEISIKKFENLIAKRVSKKILNDYMKRQGERALIQAISHDLGNLLQWIQKSDKGEFTDQQFYKSCYKKLYDMKQMHFSTNSIKKKLNFENKKIYFHIRMIGHLDEMFKDQNYKKDDYISMMKQTYENLDENAIHQMLQKIN